MNRIWRIGIGSAVGGLVLLSAFLGVGRYQEHSVRVSLEALADRLASELANLHIELKESRSEAVQSRKSLEDALSERDSLVTKLRERDELLDKMKIELSQLKIQFQKVNLGSVSVPAASAGLRQTEVETMPLPASFAQPSPAPAEGTVVAVNEEFHFVIVNLGAKNGIREGMTLAVMQDGTQAGSLRVDLVEDATCAAALLSNVNRPLKIGDPVHATS